MISYAAIRAVWRLSPEKVVNSSYALIGCFAESRRGLTAAAHFAFARPIIAFLDLDSAINLKADQVQGGMVYDKVKTGTITLPGTPGPGASINEEFLQTCEQYSVTP